MKCFLFILTLLLPFQIFSDETLEISNKTKIPKSLDFSRNHPDLKFINFWGFPKSRGYETFAHYYAEATSDYGLSKNKNLQRIGIWNVNISGLLINAYLPQVHELSMYLELGSFKDYDLTLLKAFPHLTSLIWRCQGLDEEDWEKILLYTPQLEEIYFPVYDYCQLTKQDLVYLSQLPNLKKLRIKTYQANDSYVEQLTEILKASLPSISIEIETYWDIDYLYKHDYFLPV